MTHEQPSLDHVKRVKHEIEKLTDRFNPDFIRRRRRQAIRRGSLKRMIHTIMKVLFGRDIKILNEAVDLLRNILQARIVTLILAAKTSADCAERNNIDLEDLTLAAKLLEDKEHAKMLRRSYNKWGDRRWRMYRYGTK
ncbi:hypothetical protein H2200_010506 [Cladophialophora chaetospira]|uniref:Histone H2A/H2B/H3 domain-containing protein n=1 Tax=Cladophialophora chaetospira TaxID=386627 RepID=A0AA38X1K3_9EURO|nr:hypothetical protein H2200_010506 [Cladophialophora chaetospira]